jgi:hypothetical protein
MEESKSSSTGRTEEQWNHTLPQTAVMCNITTGTIFSRLNVLSLLLYTSKKPLSNGDARVCTLVQPTDVVVCKHDACSFPTVTMHDGNERDMVADQNPQFMGSFPDT